MSGSRMVNARVAQVGVLFCALELGGCTFNQVAVNTTAAVLVEAQDTTRAYFDWESAGAAAAGGIMQLEGLHTVSPDNEDLTLMMVKAYMAYAYGWVMDAHEVAEARGDFAAAEYHQQRAHLMYTRARDLAMRVMRNRDPHFAQMARTDPASFRKYLEQEFDDAEDDAPPLFWLMMAWGAAVNSSPNLDEFVDMPAIKTIAAWAVHLDEAHEDAGALAFLASFDSSYPKQLGGDPELGRVQFERVLVLTQRKAHIYLVNYALLYAVNAQNRPLFVSLLREVIDAPDGGPRFRLANKVAKRRALRLLARVDDFFM